MFTTSGSCHTSLPHALWCTNSLITMSYLTVCPLSYQVKMPCPVAPPTSKPAVLPSDLDSRVMWPDCALPPVDLWELTFLCHSLLLPVLSTWLPGGEGQQLLSAEPSQLLFLLLSVPLVKYWMKSSLGSKVSRQKLELLFEDQQLQSQGSEQFPARHHGQPFLLVGSPTATSGKCQAAGRMGALTCWWSWSQWSLLHTQNISSKCGQATDVNKDADEILATFLNIFVVFAWNLSGKLAQ